MRHDGPPQGQTFGLWFVNIFQLFILHFNIRYCLDPVTLSGEGEYNLDILKNIDVTDSFLGLDNGVRKCENGNNTYDNCTTRFYHEQMRLKCGCLPFSIIEHKEVSTIIILNEFNSLNAYYVMCFNVCRLTFAQPKKTWNALKNP